MFLEGYVPVTTYKSYQEIGLIGEEDDRKRHNVLAFSTQNKLHNDTSNRIRCLIKRGI